MAETIEQANSHYEKFLEIGQWAGERALSLRPYVHSGTATVEEKREAIGYLAFLEAVEEHDAAIQR